MDWSVHFPAFVSTAAKDHKDDEVAQHKRMLKSVEIADIGCGFGGLLFALSPKLPDTLILGETRNPVDLVIQANCSGLEIRVSVTEFVENKIRALRQQFLSPATAPRPENDAPPQEDEHEADATTRTDAEHAQSKLEATEDISDAQPVQFSPAKGASYQNISVVRANTMKFLPNFFPKHSLRAIFLCFPDPHFKARKHKARIVSSTLNSEYAYVLKPGAGKIYTITDVEDLHLWMVEKFDGHPSFERVGDDECSGDLMVQVMTTETEEGKRSRGMVEKSMSQSGGG